MVLAEGTARRGADANWPARSRLVKGKAWSQIWGADRSGKGCRYRSQLRDPAARDAFFLYIGLAMTARDQRPAATSLRGAGVAVLLSLVPVLAGCGESQRQ